MIISSIASAKGNMEYILWIWRGDYLNLGAGGEIGIYSRESSAFPDPLDADHYFVDKSLSMPMELYLYDYNSSTDIENIFSWDPTDRQWWITGFNPEYVGNVDAASQVMIGCVDFSQFTNSEGDNEMYSKLQENVKDDIKLNKYTIFDDTNHTMWLCWYGD